MFNFTMISCHVIEMDIRCKETEMYLLHSLARLPPKLEEQLHLCMQANYPMGGLSIVQQC